MSLTRALATGQGRLEFRLVIEGLDTEFVTHKAMERAAVAASSTTARRVGLKREGIRLQESVDIPNAKLSVGGMTLRIADIGGYATQTFARFPSITAWLKEDLAASGETQISVTSVAGFSDSSVIHIDTEAIRIDVSNEDPDIFQISERAVYGTIAQKHWAENDHNMRSPEITDRPPALEGRRAYIYYYADSDIVDGSPGNGTQMYIGIVTGEPRLNDSLSEWEISIGSITSTLDQVVGLENAEPFTARGVYHPWNAPFIMKVNEGSNADHGTASYGGTFAGTVTIYGFYETQQAFVDELNTQFAALTFSQSGTLFASVIDEDLIKIEYTTGATPRSCGLNMPRTWGLYALDGGVEPHWSGRGWYDDTDSLVGSFDATSTYCCYLHTSMPRSSAFLIDTPLVVGEYDLSLADTYPDTRLYVGGSLPFTVASASAVVVAVECDGRKDEAVWIASTDDAATRSIDFNRDDVRALSNYTYRGNNFPAPPIGRVYPSFNDPEFQPYDSRYEFYITTIPVSATNVAEFLDVLADNSATYCNAGIMPFLTTTDYDQVLSERKLDPAIENRPWADPRSYIFSKAKRLGQILAEELKLIGCYPCLGTAGKLRFRKMEVPSTSSIADFDITSAKTTWFVKPMWERNSLGMLNTVEYQGAYNAREDKATGPTVTVRDVSGFGQTRIAKSISIKPLSKAVNEPGYNDLTTIASEYFGMFGYPYVIVTIGVPFSLFTHALVGTVGSFVSGVLPDELDGTRGYTTAKKGLVIGRDWDLAKGQGVLSLYVPIMRAAGYTPTVRITARTDNGSNNWTLTVSDAQWDALSSAYYSDAGSLAAYFPVGSSVRVWQWDNDSPTEIEGIVTALNSTTSISVTFESTWTPGTISTTNAWNLSYSAAEDADVTTAQKAYAYIAGLDRRIDFTTTDSAKVFGA